MTASENTELAQAEAAVEAHSAGLIKGLGARPGLTQILFIVGLTWIGVAGKLRAVNMVFWLLALTLFCLPSAAVVMYLNKLMPLEGGFISGRSWDSTKLLASCWRGISGCM
ncbi:MAG: hypothetical protein IPP90_07460 [Gemmatimonadaceae bacterium]|nr:hypothetical protein [Gemmatimonadaceae bacterium]